MTGLLAEDLLLLLLDDERGTTPMLWVDVGVPLGAAVLAELALVGEVALGEGGWWRAPTVDADPAARPADPVLAGALALVAERPRTAQDLAARIGRRLRDDLAGRLVEAGVLERHDDRVLGLFPRTRWPARSTEREEAARAALRSALLGDGAPDGRTAALAGILSALDRVPAALRLSGEDARRAKRRAKDLAAADWTSKAVRDAIAASVAAVTSTVAVTTTAGSTAVG